MNVMSVAKRVACCGAPSPGRRPVKKALLMHMCMHSPPLS